MSAEPSFEVFTERTPGRVVVTVRGELDSGTLGAVEAECQSGMSADIEELTLDLTDVSFIDSAGMRMMIQLDRAARERGMALVVLPPSEEVTELLRTAGVADRLELNPRHASAAMREFTERVELELPTDPMSPSRARAEVRELMAGRMTEQELATLVLLTSELLTNAVVHAGASRTGPIVLRIVSYEDGVRVEVEDTGEGFDPVAGPRGRDDGGQGLFLVDACAAGWGTSWAETDYGRRFCVWFELARSSEPAAA